MKAYTIGDTALNCLAFSEEPVCLGGGISRFIVLGGGRGLCVCVWFLLEISFHLLSPFKATAPLKLDK